MAMIKRHAAEVRRQQLAQEAEQKRQTEQSNAKGDTNTARETAGRALGDYNTAAENHQRGWADRNRGRFTSEDAAFDAWQIDWKESEEGKAAQTLLSPHLVNYQAAVTTELRVAAQNADADGRPVGAAVENRAGEIAARDGSNSWADQNLDDIVEDAIEGVKTESPERRDAALGVTNALDARDGALVGLKDVQDRRSAAMQGLNNRYLREEMSAGFQDELNTAQELVTTTETDLQTALDHEFAVILSGDVLASANAGVNSLGSLPPQLRRAEGPGLQSQQSAAEQQYQHVIAGGTDLTVYSSGQIDAAAQAVLMNHPELLNAQNRPFALDMLVSGEALKRVPELESSLATLTVDGDTQPWMRALIEDKGDRVTAALIASLGVDDVAPAPGDEQVLAENDPMAFAILKYAGADFSMPDHSMTNVQPAKDDIVAAGQEAAYGALEDLQVSDPEKFAELNVLMLASGDVRADFVQAEWQRLVGNETPEESVEAMYEDYLDEKDFNNPDYETNSGASEFMRVLSVNLAASFTPQQQYQVWDAVGSDVSSFIGEQADYLQSKYAGEEGSPAVIGEWLKQMGQFAPTPARDILAYETATHFSPTLVGKHGGGRMTDGLQIIAQGAPQGAGIIAEWLTSPQGDDAWQVPLRDLVAVKEDGTGLDLGQALLGELRADGRDEYSLSDLQSTYDYGAKAAEDHLREEQASEQFDLFNMDRNDKLQQIFDSAIAGTGDLYTERQALGVDPDKDNPIGLAMDLTPDNPNAGPHEAMFTDPGKLAQIHEVKQINLFGDALQLGVDDPEAHLGAARYTDPDKLAKINKMREWAKEIGGDNAMLTLTPTVYASAKSGVSTVFLVRVEGDRNNDGVITRDQTSKPSGDGRTTVELADEDMIISSSALKDALAGRNVPWKFDDFEDFQKDVQLDDDGRLYLSGSDDMLLHDADGDGHVDNINFEGVDAAITTGWEHVRRWGDVALGAAGLVAGVALAVGTGGLAAPLVAGAAALWFGYRTVETAGEMDDHGQSFNPFSTGEGAWFGFIDPAAGGLWLGGLATVSGLAALRPAAMGGALTNIGRGASLTDEMLLTSRAGVASTDLSRGIMSNLFGSKGLQFNLYRAGLSSVPRGTAWTAQGSGALLTLGQLQTFGQMFFAGQIDVRNLSIDSNLWDALLAGGGVAALGAGIAASRSHAIADAALPPSEVSPNRTRLFALNQQDGSTLLSRIDENGQLAPDVDAGWANGKSPNDILIFETSARDGGVVPENVHFYSINRDGSYRVSRLHDNPTQRPDFTPPTTPLALEGQPPYRPFDDDGYALRDPDGSYRITTLDPGDDAIPPVRDDAAAPVVIDESGTVLAGDPATQTGFATDDVTQLGTREATYLPEPVAARPGRVIGEDGTPIADMAAGYRQQLAAWLPPEMRDAPLDIRVLPDAAFDAAYLAAGGRNNPTEVSGFIDQSRAGQDGLPPIVLRQGSRNSVGHEVDHLLASAPFRELASTMHLKYGTPWESFEEGSAKYVDFKQNGPTAHAERPGGFRAYAEELAARDPAAFRQLDYLDATLAVERIADSMGHNNFLRARYGGDPAAVRQFNDTAAALFGPDLLRAQQPPHILHSPSGPPRPLQGDGFAGGQWRKFYGDLQSGAISFPETRYVYVVTAATRQGAVTFRPSDVQFYGTIRTGARDVNWRGATPPDVNGRTVNAIFGGTKPHRILVTDVAPAQILNAQGPMRFALPSGRGSPRGQLVAAPPISGEGYQGSSWITFYKRLTGTPQKLSYLGERYVYVLEVPRGKSLTFTAADLANASIGRIQKGADRITWVQGGLANQAGRTVSDIFGTPAQGKVFKFFVTHRRPDTLASETGRMSVSYPSAVPGNAVPAVRAPYVRGPLPDPLPNPYRGAPLSHEPTLLRRVDREAARYPNYLDTLINDLYQGARPAPEPSELIVRIGELAELIDPVENVAHQAHEHGEGYNARKTPEDSTRPLPVRVVRPLIRGGGKVVGWIETSTPLSRYALAPGSRPTLRALTMRGGQPSLNLPATTVTSPRALRVRGQASGVPYTFRMALLRGPFAEVWVCGIPQGCGVSHYTELNARPPSYKGSDLLDQRHLNDYKTALSNYNRWAGYMRRTATELGPDVASQIDLLAISRDDAGLRAYVDTLTMSPRLAKNIVSLATTDRTRPHLAANLHIAVTGFNPATREAAFYLVERFNEYYQLIAGAGESTFIKENIEKQLKTLMENFDFDNPDHVLNAMIWLTTMEFYQKHTVAHSDNHRPEPNMSGDGRLQPDVQVYRQHDQFMDMVAPFPRITHAHAGGGRYAKMDTTLIPNTHPVIDGLDYGPTITRQVDAMERAVAAKPDMLFDNSWNDNAHAVGTNDRLSSDFQLFARRHPKNMDNGSDAVKPVNRGQARQHGVTNLPWIAELGLNDKGALLQLLRKNFERTVHDGKLDSAMLADIGDRFETLAAELRTPGSQTITDPVLQDIAQTFVDKTNAAGPAKGAEIAAVLDQLAQKVQHSGPPTEYPIMDTVWHGLTVPDAAGNPVVIVRGREQMRGLGEEAFAKINFERFRDVIENWRSAEPPARPAITGSLPPGRKSLKPVVHDTTDLANAGTSAGLRRVAPGRAEALREVMADLLPVTLGLGLGIANIPMTGDLMTLLRQLGFADIVNRLETDRLRWENQNEEGQIRTQDADVTVRRIVEVGREIGVDEADLMRVAVLYDQLLTDITYLREISQSWPDDRKTQVFDMIMAAIGINQVSGDAHLGVQQPSLTATDPRTAGGRNRNRLIMGTAAGNIATGGWATWAASQNPDLANQMVWLASTTAASGGATVLMWSALGTMIGQKIIANRRGKQLLNPELGETYNKLQHRILAGIEGSAALGVVTEALLLAAPGGGLLEPVMRGLAAAGVVALGERARFYERERITNHGTEIPAKAAKATNQLLGALAIGALVGLAFALKEMLDDDNPGVQPGQTPTTPTGTPTPTTSPSGSPSTVPSTTPSSSGSPSGSSAPSLTPLPTRTYIRPGPQP